MNTAAAGRWVASRAGRVAWMMIVAGSLATLTGCQATKKDEAATAASQSAAESGNATAPTQAAAPSASAGTTPAPAAAAPASAPPAEAAAAKSAEAASAEAKAAEAKAAELKAAETKAAEAKAAEAKAAEAKAAEAKAAEARAAEEAAKAAVPVTFLTADNAKAIKTTKRDNGLIIEDLRLGEGAEVRPGATVTINYHGTLKDGGSMFDTTRGKQPATFPLGRLIRGWQEGVPGMKPGGVRRLTIPYALAYGEAGRPPVIPAKSDLVFIIEMIGVVEPAK